MSAVGVEESDAVSSSLFFLLFLSPAFPISKARQVADTIHVALAVDSKSARDSIIVAASVVNSAFVPENIFLHVVTTGVDMTYSESLATELKDHLKSCLPVLALHEHYEVKPFVLPKDRGFGAQLERKKTVSMGGRHIGIAIRGLIWLGFIYRKYSLTWNEYCT